MKSRRSEADLQALQGHGVLREQSVRRRGAREGDSHHTGARMTTRRSDNDLQALLAGAREQTLPARAGSGLPRAWSTEILTGKNDGRLPQDRFLKRWERFDLDSAPSAPAAGLCVTRLQTDAQGALRTPVQGALRTPVQGALRTPVNEKTPVSGTPVSVREKAGKPRPKRHDNETRQYAMNRNLAAWCAQERERALQPHRPSAVVSTAPKLEGRASTPVAIAIGGSQPHFAPLAMLLSVLTSLASRAHILLRTWSVDVLVYAARLVPGRRAAQSPQAELERRKNELQVAEAALVRAQTAVMQAESRLTEEQRRRC